MKPSFELTPQQRYDIVTYRIENAQKTLGEIKDLVALKYYNTAANRMYYACYYAASALLIANGIATKSHDGVKQMFGLHFIKTGVLPMHLSSIYSTLFKRRLSGDYDDMFDNTLESVTELYLKAQEFISAVKDMLTNGWLKTPKREPHKKNINQNFCR